MLRNRRIVSFDQLKCAVLQPNCAGLLIQSEEAVNSPQRRVTGNSGGSLVAAFLLLAISGFVACSQKSQETPQQRNEAAKTLFEQTAKNFHLASAEAGKPAREKLLRQAADGYATLLKNYSDQAFWAVQAMRSLGNVRAAQGRLDEAIKLYVRMEKEYPDQEWELLQAWKSAADLLWEANRRAEAKAFYQRIVQRFDKTEATAVIKAVVRGSKARLAETGVKD